MAKKPQKIDPTGRASYAIPPLATNPYINGNIFQPDLSGLSSPTPTIAPDFQTPAQFRGLAGTLASGVGALGTSINQIERPETGTGILSGALSGAGAGAMLGPLGALGGAAIGAAGGFINSKMGQQSFDVQQQQQYDAMMQTNTMRGRDLGYYKYGGKVYAMGGDVEQTVPIQAEKGEMIFHPSGEITPVKATDKHNSMNYGEVTDMLPQGSFVASNDKSMKIDPYKAEGYLIGEEPYMYEQGKKTAAPKTRTLSDVVTKKMTPAEIFKVLEKKFPTTKANDEFANAANESNMEFRKTYVDKVREFTEERSPQPTQHMKKGGSVYDPLTDYTNSFAPRTSRLPFAVTGAPHIFNAFGTALQTAGIMGQEAAEEPFSPNPSTVNQAFQKIPTNRLLRSQDNYTVGQQRSSLDAASRAGANAFEQSAIMAGPTAEAARNRGSLAQNAYLQNVETDRARGQYMLGVQEKATASRNRETTFNNQKKGYTTQYLANGLQNAGNIAGQVFDRGQRLTAMDNIRQAQIDSQNAMIDFFKGLYGPEVVDQAVQAGNQTNPTSPNPTTTPTQSPPVANNQAPATEQKSNPTGQTGNQPADGIRLYNGAILDPNLLAQMAALTMGQLQSGAQMQTMNASQTEEPIDGGTLDEATVIGEGEEAGVGKYNKAPTIRSEEEAALPDTANPWATADSVNEISETYTTPGDPYEYREFNNKWQASLRGEDSWFDVSVDAYDTLDGRYKQDSEETTEPDTATTGDAGTTEDAGTTAAVDNNSIKSIADNIDTAIPDSTATQLDSIIKKESRAKVDGTSKRVTGDDYQKSTGVYSILNDKDKLSVGSGQFWGDTWNTFVEEVNEEYNLGLTEAELAKLDANNVDNHDNITGFIEERVKAMGGEDKWEAVEKAYLFKTHVTPAYEKSESIIGIDTSEDEAMAHIAADMGVNHSGNGVGKIMQAAKNRADKEGVDIDSEEFLNILEEERIKYGKKYVAKNLYPGWLKRVKKVAKEALEMRKK